MDDALLREAEWSDAFFNYVPAEQSWQDRRALIEAAKMFREANTECPYSVRWLVKDFLDRL